MKSSYLFTAGLYISAVWLSGLLLCVNSFAQENLNELRVQSLETLDDLRRKISLSDTVREQITKQIEAIDLDRRSFNEQLLETTEKTRHLEQKIAQTSTKFARTQASYSDLKSSLDSKSGLMAEVLAALQRIGRNPPPALLVTPQDALTSVRSSILLGSVIPEIRSQTAILLRELNELALVKTELKQNRSKLVELLKSIIVQEAELSLLIRKKQKLSRTARAKLAKNEVAAAKLAARASSIESLINQLETQIDVVKDATKEAALIDEQRQESNRQQLNKTRKAITEENFSDNLRIKPAVEFVLAKNKLPKPVNGVVVQKFGETNDFGEISKSMEIATLSNAHVISPADGWVVYSGPFKSYGQMLILNAGTKHHIILSGMKNINVELGQFVLLGEPVGIMGTRRIASTQDIDVGSIRPILSVEFRRDGRSINPDPWWRDETTTKVEQ